MAQMRRGNSSGVRRAAKSGTRVTKTQGGAVFGPRRQGISAHGMSVRVESRREAKDRILG